MLGTLEKGAVQVGQFVFPFLGLTPPPPPPMDIGPMRFRLHRKRGKAGKVTARLPDWRRHESFGRPARS